MAVIRQTIQYGVVSSKGISLSAIGYAIDAYRELRVDEPNHLILHPSVRIQLLQRDEVAKYMSNMQYIYGLKLIEDHTLGVDQWIVGRKEINTKFEQTRGRNE